jgi:hypothetical protein
VPMLRGGRERAMAGRKTAGCGGERWGAEWWSLDEIAHGCFKWHRLTWGTTSNGTRKVAFGDVTECVFPCIY